HPYGITDFGQEPTFLAKHSCAWCVSACPWRATPTVSSGGQRLLPPRQPALGHGLLHLPAVEEAVRERYRLAGHLQGHPARGSVMGLQHLPELLEDAPSRARSSAGWRGGLRSSGPVPWLWGPVVSRMRSSVGVCPAGVSRPSLRRPQC